MGLFAARGLIIYNQATTLATLCHTGRRKKEVIRGHVITRMMGILLILRTSLLLMRSLADAGSLHKKLRSRIES